MKQYEITIHGQQNKAGIALPVRHGKVVFVEDLRAWLEKEIKKEGRNYNEAMTKEDYLYKDEFACSYHYTHKRFKELLALLLEKEVEI